VTIENGFLEKRDEVVSAIMKVLKDMITKAGHLVVKRIEIKAVADGRSVEVTIGNRVITISPHLVHHQHVIEMSATKTMHGLRLITIAEI
jgi:hypothetical protein